RRAALEHAQRIARERTAILGEYVDDAKREFAHADLSDAAPAILLGGGVAPRDSPANRGQHSFYFGACGLIGVSRSSIMRCAAWKSTAPSALTLRVSCARILFWMRPRSSATAYGISSWNITIE